MNQYVNYTLFLDNEPVGEGSVWMVNGRVRGAGGPLGLVGYSPTGRFEDLFILPVVKVEDTGEPGTFGEDPAMQVNVYLLSEEKYRLHLLSANGGSTPLTLPF